VYRAITITFNNHVIIIYIYIQKTSYEYNYIILLEPYRIQHMQMQMQMQITDHRWLRDATRRSTHSAPPVPINIHAHDTQNGCESGGWAGAQLAVQPNCPRGACATESKCTIATTRPRWHDIPARQRQRAFCARVCVRPFLYIFFAFVFNPPPPPPPPPPPLKQKKTP